MEFIAQLFSAFCGQAPAHTWAPGGDLLPCCQRCTGLYAGALVAALLHATCKPRLTGRFLAVHGGLLLLMVPFGNHWLPQGAALRAITGVLFGAGLVTFLPLPLLSLHRFKAWREVKNPPVPQAEATYFAGVFAAAWLVPWAAEHGSHNAFLGLSLATAAGALVLALLLLFDAAVLLVGIAKRWGRGGTHAYRMQGASAPAGTPSTASVISWRPPVRKRKDRS